MMMFERPLVYQGNRELWGLQVLKFVCALMVVQIHTESFVKIGVLRLCQIAVPVFFMISGYFMVSLDGTLDRDRIARALVKILKIMVLATVVYVVFSVGFWAIGRRELTYWSLDFVWRELLFGEGVRVHLWYLLAYAQCLGFVVVMLKWGGWKRLVYVAIPLGLLMNLLLGAYSFVIFDSRIDLCFSRNVLTVALPCFLIGMLIRGYEGRMLRGRKVTVLFVTVWGLLYAEGLLRHLFAPSRSGDGLIFTIPVAVLAFLIFLRMSHVKGVLRRIGEWGRKYSLDIYLWHPLVFDGWMPIRDFLGFTSGLDWPVVALLTMGCVALLKPTENIMKLFSYSNFQFAVRRMRRY